MAEKYVPIKAVKKKLYSFFRTYSIPADMRKTILGAIDKVPAEDVEKPVHCKDCKHLEITGCYGECGKAILGIVSPDDFCSRGERRTDNE